MDIPRNLEARGIQQENRLRLETLHRAVDSPFDVGSAAVALGMERRDAGRFLAYLAERGWLIRLRRGLYATVPLGAGISGEWREDPWAIAVKLFSPCYMGGWTACEHWGLTEQIFRDVVVMTAAPVRKRVVNVQDTAYQLKHLAVEKHFGMRNEWVGKQKVPVSDPSRTIVDVLDEPRLGGGIRHIAEMLESYFESKHRNERLLLEYAERLGNRTVFKRLGYLSETLELGDATLIAACNEAVSAGLSSLDPSVRQKGTVVKRWNLRANVPIGNGGEAA
jgi:predicted transcriptional regulator of viral defense system